MRIHPRFVESNDKEGDREEDTLNDFIESSIGFARQDVFQRSNEEGFDEVEWSRVDELVWGPHQTNDLGGKVGSKDVVCIIDDVLVRLIEQGDEDVGEEENLNEGIAVE